MTEMPQSENEEELQNPMEFKFSVAHGGAVLINGVCVQLRPDEKGENILVTVGGSCPVDVEAQPSPTETPETETPEASCAG